MNMRAVIIAATVLSSNSLFAQSAAEHIVLGDKDFEAMNAAGALRHYQEAIKIDANNAEALWKAAVQSIDLGEFNDPARDSLVAQACASGQRIGQMPGRVVISAHRGGKPALRPQARRLRAERRLRQQQHRFRRHLQRRHQSGGTAADDDGTVVER